MRNKDTTAARDASPLDMLTVDQVGGPAQHAIERNGGKVAWHRRRSAPAVQAATFPPGTLLVTLSPQEEAQYRLSDDMDRQWIRLPDGTLLLKHRRFARTYLTTVLIVNACSLESEMEFLHHRWFDYQQATRSGRSDPWRDPPEVMREQLVRSARRIAALLPYDEQLRLAERGRDSSAPQSVEQALWQAIFDAYAAFPGEGDPLDPLVRKLRSQNALRSRLLLESALPELRGDVPRFLYRGHTQPVQVVAWSPDGKLVASSGDGGKVHLTTAKASALCILPPWDNGIVDLCWSADGMRISTLSPDGFLRTWDVETRACLQHLALELAVQFAWWSPDGTRLAVSEKQEGNLAVVDLVSGQRTLSIPAPEGGCGPSGWECSWSADGTRLAAAHEAGKVQVWELPFGLLRFHTHVRGPVRAAALAPDGNLLALAGEHEEIEVWDTETGAQARTYHAHTQRTRALAWSPGGGTLASTSDDGTLRLWRYPGGEPDGHCYSSSSALVRPLFSPSGRRVAAVASDGTVHVLEERGQRWEPCLIYLGHLGCRIPRRALAWSADGMTLASAGRETRRDASDATIHVWAPVPTQPER